jgi:hypothetical protein
MFQLRRFSVCSAKEGTVCEKIQWWWYMLSCIFSFVFEISLQGIHVKMAILFIDLHFDIQLPYFTVPFPYWFEKTFSWLASWDISKYNGGELQIMPNRSLACGIAAYLTMHQDHAGFTLELNLLFCTIILQIYDSRHWDNDKNNFEI